MKEKYLNKEFNSNNCGKFIVIDYFGSTKCTVQFEDGTIIKNVSSFSVRDGRIINRNFPKLCGIGFEGYGKYSVAKDKKAGSVWHNIISMCYNEKAQDRCPTYKDVTVCKEWHNFQNFAEWFYENYDFNTEKTWYLTKGILVKKSKIYSPETCCFAPQEILKQITISNLSKDISLPMGVYKQSTFLSSFGGKQIHGFETAEDAFENYKERKEAYLKQLAEEWKPKIPIKLYSALINYRVEITD
jgi:hypothetical protein